MELTHDNRVFFDPTSHSYMLDDETLLMGVTQLMRKHNLGADYSGIPESVLKKAAAIGSELHKEIQDYENGETILATELIDEYKKLGLRFIEAEYPVSDFQTVASAIDMVYEGSSKDSVILVDIKSTEKLHRRALDWQLGIYRTLFERQNPGVKVEGLFCLHIDKKARKVNGLYPVDGVTETEVDALLQTEREGLIYVDENDKPCADLVLNEDELTAYIEHAVKIAELKAAIKQIEEGLKAYDKRLLAYMADNGIDEMSAPGGVFKKKAAYSQTRVNTEKLKKTWPAVYESCVKNVEVAASISFKQNK